MAEETQTTQENKEHSGAQTAGGDPTSSTTTPAPAQAEKTFTQAEVNELIKARLERERRARPQTSRKSPRSLRPPTKHAPPQNGRRQTLKQSSPQ